jgi:hypothetical protein
MIEISDPQVVAASGARLHPMVVETGDPADEVPGTLEAAELAAAGLVLGAADPGKPVHFRVRFSTPGPDLGVVCWIKRRRYTKMRQRGCDNSRQE